MTAEQFAFFMFGIAVVSGLITIYCYWRLVDSVNEKKDRIKFVFEDEYHRAFLQGVTGDTWEGTLKNPEYSLFVKLRSEDCTFDHDEYSQLKGKHIRVTIEVLN